MGHYVRSKDGGFVEIHESTLDALTISASLSLKAELRRLKQSIDTEENDVVRGNLWVQHERTAEFLDTIKELWKEIHGT